MGLAIRVLSIVMCFLLLCSFVTSMVGTGAPSFQKALTMLSEIDIDTERLVKLLGLAGHEGIPLFELPEKSDVIIESVVGLANNFINMLNDSFDVVLLLLGAIDVVLQVLESSMIFVRTGFYLVFGIDYMASVPAT